MKKIFLLSLLSVFFLSAFSQVIDGNAEVITKINIIRSSEDISPISNDVNLKPETGIWIFFWGNVTTYHNPDGGVTVMCSGWGLKLCVPKMKGSHISSNRGISEDAVEKTCEDIVTESDDLVSHGECKGSVTKKIAFSDPQANGRTSYLIYQMNWDYDAKNPRNGTAEIIITKVNNLGIKY